MTGFRVDFPGTPAISGSNAAGTRYGMSATVTAKLTTGDGVTFHITYTAYPAGTASREPQKVLDTMQLGRTAVGNAQSCGGSASMATPRSAPSSTGMGLSR